MNGTGQYRTRGENGSRDIVFVTDRSISFEIYETLYRWRGYEPSFDLLPWKHDLPSV